MAIATLTPIHFSSYRLDSLPINVLNHILTFIPVSDLNNLAQTNKTMFKVVDRNDDIWIQRFQNMGFWKNHKSSIFENSLNSFTTTNQDALPQGSSKDTATSVFQLTESVNRENARETFMRIYKTLHPLYIDIIQCGTHTEPLLFRIYRDTVDQAKVLAQLKIFAKADPLEKDHYEKLEKFNTVYEMFENAALAEFELGYDEKDIEGRVKKYAKVLVTLNGGESCVQLFIQKNKLVLDTFNDPSEIIMEESGKLDNKKLQLILKNLSDSINLEALLIDELFPPSIPVLLPLCEQIIEDNISELFNSAIFKFRETGSNINNYLEAVPFLYVHMMWFINELNISNNSGKDFRQRIKHIFLNLYDLNIDTYLEREYQEFAKYSASETQKWNEEVAEQENAAETFLLSNVTKEKDKNDILSSFKRVLMKPVSVIPFGNSSTSSLTDQSTKNSASIVMQSPSTGISGTISPRRPETPTINRHLETNVFHQKPGSSSMPLPTTELDARAAVMKNKLEGINTLFSLELTLNIMRQGRDAIERASKFISTGGATGEEAREKCEEIFVELVRTIGGVHVRGGFEKALDTLNKYDARALRKILVFPNNGPLQGSELDNTQSAVEPLAIFAELVNIGDLIQQMIHVFFEEELAIPGYVDRLSFISPANREKKKFEKMLDSYVANGMNRGIDVLMEQIDYILLMEQQGSDFNPTSQGTVNRSSFISTNTVDITPTPAASKVVSLLKTHVNLLAGSTEKSVIDVFQQEIAVRFFGSLSKHIKRQIVSVDGSVKLLCDLNLYYNFILSLKQRSVIPYFIALKEIGQIFLIDGKDAKALGQMLSDTNRFEGIFQPEEVFEFAQCREDWLRVRRDVEKVMYGFGMSDCCLM